MESKNIKKLFNEITEKLIQDIATQYVEIFKIVKKACPNSFSNDQVTLVFLKTESMFNNIQVMKVKKDKKKNHNGNGNGNGKTALPKENERTKEFYS